jgi:hypothetical protein
MLRDYSLYPKEYIDTAKAVQRVFAAPSRVIGLWNTAILE